MIVKIKPEIKIACDGRNKKFCSSVGCLYLMKEIAFCKLFHRQLRLRKNGDVGGFMRTEECIRAEEETINE